MKTSGSLFKATKEGFPISFDLHHSFVHPQTHVGGRRGDFRIVKWYRAREIVLLETLPSNVFTEIREETFLSNKSLAIKFH